MKREDKYKSHSKPRVKASKYLSAWLRSLFPKRGVILAGLAALQYEQQMTGMIKDLTIGSLLDEIAYCKEIQGKAATNIVEKAIYKRLRRRLKNRYYDLKEKE